MQLCEKLCKKIFHSGFGGSDYSETVEVPNVQLISSSKTNPDQYEAKPPTVVLLEPTPIHSNSESKKSVDLNPSTMEPVKTATIPTADTNDVVLKTDEDQGNPGELSEDNIELQLLSDLETNELENEKVLSMLDKSTEEADEVTIPRTMIETVAESGDNEKEKDGGSDNDSLEEAGDSSAMNIIYKEGYEELDDNSKRLATKYGDLGGELILLNLPNPRLSNCSLGFKLSGNKNLSTMGVFICHITPNSLADIDGRVNVGDAILEVDDHILYGRSHLNVTPIIRACNNKLIKFVIHRSTAWAENMAIPVSYRAHEIQESYSNTNSRRGSYQDSEHEYNQSRKTSTVSLGPVSSKNAVSTEEAHTIYLNKSTQGFGFAIMERSFTNEEGIFIKHIAPAGPAAQDGSLRPGDKLISINNQDISSASYETALDLLKNCKSQVRLVVTRVRCSHSPTHSNATPVKNLYQKRLSAPHITTIPTVINRSISPTIVEEKPDSPTQGILIKTIPESESGLTTLAKSMADLNARRRSSLSNLPSAEVVTMLLNHMADDDNVDVITISRGNQPLGMSIIGGSDTFIGDVIVHDIFSNGVIATDGRINVGDRITMINDTSLVDQTNEEVVNMLQSSCPDITLKVRHPDSPILDQDIYEVVTTVELSKKPTKGLGISIIGREGAKGVYVCDVVKGGVADVDGRLQPGDQILEINGEDFRNSSQEETATTLKFLMGNVVMKIGRIQKMVQHYTPTYLMTNDDSGDHNKTLGKHLVPGGPGHSPARLSMASPAHAR